MMDRRISLNSAPCTVPFFAFMNAACFFSALRFYFYYYRMCETPSESQRIS